MVVGARQSVQVFRQNIRLLESSRALSKFLYGVSHYLISIAKLEQDRFIKPKFILTTRATLNKATKGALLFERLF